MTHEPPPVVADDVRGMTVGEVFLALFNLPSTYDHHSTRDALLQFTFDGEEFFVIDQIEDIGEGGVIAQLVPLNDGEDHDR